MKALQNIGMTSDGLETVALRKRHGTELEVAEVKVLRFPFLSDEDG